MLLLLLLPYRLNNTCRCPCSLYALWKPEAVFASCSGCYNKVD